LFTEAYRWTTFAYREEAQAISGERNREVL
jgi:hypothetical protein